MNRPRDNRYRGGKANVEQHEVIQKMARLKFSPRQIAEELSQQFKYPLALRSIQELVKAVRDNRIPWNRFATSGDDAKLALEVLPEVIRRSKGQKLEFTQEEADTIIWVRKVAPTLPPEASWDIAIAYMTLERTPDSDKGSLDALLAYKPWESGKALEAYDNLKIDGILKDSFTSLASEIRSLVYHQDDVKPADAVQPIVGEYYTNEEGDFVPVPLPPELQAEIDRLRKEGESEET